MATGKSFTGVYPILPTPFRDDETLDLDGFRRIVEFMVTLDVSGVTILGVLGEANRMTDGERSELVRTAVEAASGRIPVVVGTSHSGTRAAADLSREAESLGAAGVMVTPHHEPTPNPERVFEYFARIGDRCSLPIVLQDHPVSTQVHMSVDLVLRIVDEVKTVQCVKQEAVPSPSRVAALASGMKGSRPVSILTGLGALYAGFELLRGSDGFMTGFAFPEALQAMVRAREEGDQDRVMEIYTRFLPLIVFEQQPGAAIRKEIFRMRGLMQSGRVRHPGGGIDEGTRRQLEAVIQRVLGKVDIGMPVTV